MVASAETAARAATVVFEAPGGRAAEQVPTQGAAPMPAPASPQARQAGQGAVSGQVAGRPGGGGHSAQAEAPREEEAAAAAKAAPRATQMAAPAEKSAAEVEDLSLDDL